MRKLFLLIFLSPLMLFGQNSGKIWTEFGVSSSVNKKIDLGLSLSSRYGVNGLETFFPQASFKYKLTNWFRPSIDYRFIGNRELTGVFSYNSRINLNAEFKHSLDRLTMKARIRYQYSFDRFISASAYNPEFDQALRGKMEFSYDINSSIISPVISGELFYNPKYGPYGQQVNKVRLYCGIDLEFKGPHSASIGYMYDTRINLPKPSNRHILNVSYTYEIEPKKK